MPRLRTAAQTQGSATRIFLSSSSAHIRKSFILVSSSVLHSGSLSPLVFSHVAAERSAALRHFSTNAVILALVAWLDRRAWSSWRRELIRPPSRILIKAGIPSTGSSSSLAISCHLARNAVILAGGAGVFCSLYNLAISASLTAKASLNSVLAWSSANLKARLVSSVLSGPEAPASSSAPPRVFLSDATPEVLPVHISVGQEP